MHAVGRLVLSRLVDVGEQVRLSQVSELLAAHAPERVRPARSDAAGIRMPNPPVTAHLDQTDIVLEGIPCAVDVTVRCYDFGVIAFRVAITPSAPQSWDAWAALGVAAEASPTLRDLFDRHQRTFLARIHAVVERPAVSEVQETYTVYRFRDVANGSDGPLRAAEIPTAAIARLLLNETQPLVEETVAALFPRRYSYYPDDLAVLAWDNALVIDPAERESDVEIILEFANAQLLELRHYDRLLDGEITQMYADVTALRTRPRRWLPERPLLPSRRYATLLARLQSLMVDIGEPVERAANALRVTDDVFLARIYAGALDVFRGAVWRADVERKLALVQQTYTMLNDENQSRRTEIMELCVIALIALEIVLALLGRV